MVQDVACVAQTLRAAARLVTRRYEDALRPVGLTASQYTILHALNAAGPIGPTELGKALAFEQTTATRLLAKLVADGLVQFVPHKTDSRRRMAQLTELGQTRYQQALPLWTHVQNDTLDQVSDTDWQTLRALLKQIS